MTNQVPKGLIDVQDVLRYLASDCYMDKSQTAEYMSISVRNLEGRLSQIPHFRLGVKTLFRKSEIDSYMERHRENPEAIDLERLADEVVAQVLGRSE